MIAGILVVLVLAAAGGRIGFVAGNSWVDHNMNSADGLGEPLVLFVWTAGGVLAGLALGLGIAYVLGKRERD